MTQTKERLIDLGDTGLTDEELFTRIPQVSSAMEKIVAPRYSYWRSVARVFFAKKLNVIAIVFLAFILVFTYILPHVHYF